MSRSRLVGGVAVAVVVACFGVATTQASAAPSTTVVISEVYGGGGNSGAPYNRDFVELAVAGSAAQDVSGWSVQYLSASPSAGSQWGVTDLSGTVSAGTAYLIGEASGGSTGGDLPPTQDSGGTNMSATHGTVALVDSATALTCKTSADCAADPSIVDLVGFGDAVVHEGAADADAGSNTTSVARTTETDTDDNGADFAAGDPTPAQLPGQAPPSTTIEAIQGDGWLSPKDGQSVSGVAGIVTGVRLSSSRGYWMQDPTPDTDPTTSDGIFVYTGSAPAVDVGDAVLVSGKVSDFYPLGSGESVSSTSNLSVTEIDSATTDVQSTGNALPGPVVIGPDTVPDLYAPDLGGDNIEDTAVDPSRSALDWYEAHEGMRVEVDDARVVGPSNTFGEQYVTTKPDQNRTYRGGTELEAENATPSGRLEVVTANGGNLHLDVGDVLPGPTVGPLDYSRFGGYALVATTSGTAQHNGLPPVVARPGRSDQLSVATYNVENLAPSDPDSKFNALAEGVVTNLASPDIVALEEVQDNTGASDDGTVAADQTLDRLIAAIKNANGPSYAYREVDPVNDQDGGQPGGNIRNVFLFDPSRVSFVDAGPASVDRSTTGTQVIKSHGHAAVTLSPGRIDPTNPVWTDSRKPLVGQFRFGNRDVFVIGNHFDSKLGDQNADGRFQYPAQSSAVQRAGQAHVVHDFVADLLGVDKKADVVVLGDLNDYQFSPALHVLTTGTASATGPRILTDLITTLPQDQQYTYVFDGISEVLDHILVTPAVGDVTYQVVHVNAEYSNQVSDHDPQVVDFSP